MSIYSPERVPIAARNLMELMLKQSSTWTCTIDGSEDGFTVYVDNERLGTSLYDDVLYKAAVEYMLERGYIAAVTLPPKACYQVTFRGLGQADQWQIHAGELEGAAVD